MKYERTRKLIRVWIDPYPWELNLHLSNRGFHLKISRFNLRIWGLEIPVTKGKDAEL